MSLLSSPLCSCAVRTAAALLLMAAATGAQAVYRCEDRDGRITYTDEPCPSTARTARRVDDSPPVQSGDNRDAPAKSAPETRETRDADGKDAPRVAAETRPAAPQGSLQPGRIVASTSPEQEIQRLDELRTRQQRQCTELRRRADYARRDLQSAIGADRASAELALRRLQEEARLVCPPK